MMSSQQFARKQRFVTNANVTKEENVCIEKKSPVRSQLEVRVNKVTVFVCSENDARLKKLCSTSRFDIISFQAKANVRGRCTYRTICPGKHKQIVCLLDELRHIVPAKPSLIYHAVCTYPRSVHWEDRDVLCEAER